MSKKTVIISAAALGVLAAVLAVVLIFIPADDSKGASSEDEIITVNVTDKKRENVEAVSVVNEHGSFLFTRSENTVDGKTEFSWSSGEMLGAVQNNTRVNAFIGGLAGLSRQPLVEQNAENLEKYGLENPLATVKVTFDDGTETELFFGVNNPSDTSVYFRVGDRNVMTADKETVSGVYRDIKDFVQLTLTESLSDTTVERVTVERKDLENAVEIRYMSDILGDDDFVQATSNTHRFISPFTAEVDASTGSAVYNDLCFLTMSRCAFLEQSEENMRSCGLDDPYAVVSFTLGINEYRLLIGNEIKRELDGGLSEVTGYYAVLESTKGIFELDKEDAVWCTFDPEKLISRRPLSPYIYYVKSIDIKTADGEFEFVIDGEEKRFFYGEKELETGLFRSYYQQLIGTYGEEYYTEETNGEPVFSVKFVYSEEYADKYGFSENTVEFCPLDERKNVAVIDGNPIFKVSAIYAERLCENVLRLINGEELLNL
ncbi:MAG: DUF4340 domain-containing protein [Oscillospiraceae bacterium]|nr:DUF4340 domain-containing protein [Oscillospiraceae bacterium]